MVNNNIQIYNMNCFDLINKLKSENIKINAIITDPPYGIMKDSQTGKAHKIEQPIDWDLFTKGCYDILENNSFFGFFQLWKTAEKMDWFHITKNNGFTSKEDIVWDKMTPANYMSNSLKIVHENFYIYQKGQAKLNDVKYDYLGYELQDQENIGKAVLNWLGELNTLFKILKNYDDGQLLVRLLNKDTHPLSDEDLAKLDSGDKRKQVDISHFDYSKTKTIRRGIADCKRVVIGGSLKSVIKILSPNKNLSNERVKHPNVKPIELIELIIKSTTKEGDLVFDPFLGSGTTAIACKNTNRRFIGCELDSEYFEIIKQRLNI